MTTTELDRLRERVYIQGVVRPEDIGTLGDLINALSDFEDAMATGDIVRTARAAADLHYAIEDMDPVEGDEDEPDEEDEEG